MIRKRVVSSIDWNKVHGMIPVVVQNNFSGKVLMLGYMNREALNMTIKKKVITFYSRVKNRLWTKGEKSGNYLKVLDIILDCDLDSILILSDPIGKTCHLNKISCFDYKRTCFDFLYKLEDIIEKRKNFFKNSYTHKLYNSGIERIAQKVGEEAIETVLSSLGKNNIRFIDEVSDLIYHLLVLIHYKDLNMKKVINNLLNRNKVD
ncbi:bifunctional phosphoribosyl-AMP cyclohydrolase/phosphoribosyl-ATP diphosphatase HisIE [Buchnera aphidicola (Chaitoregma tattakana)]|uniref:bifunctional phosphoribosyl-AMP cyclohydrolase/phosphoribosyl-ATP diphosphatase HisIE n=1 Tax=Buchnera aphidicola TaxID=9 RepID=UPI0031B88E44